MGFLSFPAGTDQLEKEGAFNEHLNDLMQNGHCNSDLAECISLAIANIVKQGVRVCSSRIAHTVVDINKTCFRLNLRSQLNLLYCQYLVMSIMME